ncbi:MAG: hypothetical protein ACI8QZ_000376 [Chlamydiales bacterium]|jgi:hypothetical protein
MSATRTFIDPEISGLMREILSNPKAKLFNTPSPKQLPGVTGMMTPVGLHQAGLVPAERHLLQVYRQEVAWLLRQAALTRLYEDPKKGRLLRKSITVDRTLELLDTREIGQRLQTARNASDGANIPDEEWDVFQLATSPNGTPADVARLCQASLRLAPSDEVRIYLGVDMGMRAQTESAVSLLEDVVQSASSDLIASYAWQNIGMLKAEAGQPEEAFIAYISATSTPEIRPVPAIASLHFAVRSESPSRILWAAALIDQFLEPTHTAIVEHCSSPTSRALETSGMRILEGLLGRLGPTSRRVTDAFFKA